MYPKLLDGDFVLVQRTTSVDSGSIAVILYNGDEATVKKVKYSPNEDWVELIPSNLEKCRVIGKVVKLLRDL